MAENLTNVSSEDVVEGQDYIDTINELKATTVSKTQYDKLKSENKKLLDALVKGESVEVQSTKPPVDLDKLRIDLWGDPDTQHTACDFFEKLLSVREECMARGETDPAVAATERNIPTANDYEEMERTCAVVRECLDYANGDSELFTNELMRHMVDTPAGRIAASRRR
jgi:hypothetical protein